MTSKFRERLVGMLLVPLLPAIFLLEAPSVQASEPFGTETCRLLSGPASAVAAAEECPGVRPGALIFTEGGQCTMSFLFKGSDKRRYVGTAGHCLLEGDGTRSWSPGTGSPALGASGERIGESAYATLGSDDFALVRLDKGVEWRPDMCVFGGPTGLNDERASDPVVLNFYGNGSGIGIVPGINQPVVPARSALAPNTSDAKVVWAAGPAIFGDSGSAVNSEDGRAIGTLIGMDQQGVKILRLGPQIRGAQAELGIRLKLLTTKNV